jgi:hypothetical protein
MSRKVLVASSLALCLAAAFAAIFRTAAPASSVFPERADADSLAASTSEPLLARPSADAGEAERAPTTSADDAELAAVPGPGDTDLSLPHAFAVEFKVVGACGEPLSGAQIFLAPPLAILNRAGETNQDGLLRVEWRGRVPRMTMTCGALQGDDWSGLRTVDVLAGATQRRTLQLGPPAATVSIAHNSPELEQVAQILLARVQGESHAFRIVSHTALVHPGRPECESPPELGAQLHPGVVFVGADPPQPPPPPPPQSLPTVQEAEALARYASSLHFLNATQMRAPLLVEFELDANFNHAVLWQRELSVALIRGRIAPAEPLPPRAKLSGVARDGNGNPVRGAMVQFFCTARTWTTTGEDGAFEFGELEPGSTAEVVVGGGLHGRASARFTFQAGDDLRWEPVLDRGLEVRARLVDDAGHALGGWTVQVENSSDEPAWSCAAITDDQGRFAIPNCPAGPLRLAAFDASIENLAFPSAWLPVSAGARESVIEIVDARTGSIRVWPRDTNGAQLEGAIVRVWQVATGRGAWMTNADDGSLRIAGLARGLYRIEVGTATNGWRDLGSVWVDDERELEVDSPRFECSGTLELAAAPLSSLANDVRFAIYARGDETDHLVHVFDEAPPERFTLPAGRYVLVAGGDELAPRGFAFEIRAATATRLALESERGASTELAFDVDDGAEPMGTLTIRLVDPATGSVLAVREIGECERRAVWRVHLERRAYRVEARDAHGCAATLDLDGAALESKLVRLRSGD